MDGTGEVMTALRGEAAEQAERAVVRDIDAILARLEDGIAAERHAIDALLEHMAAKAQG